MKISIYSLTLDAANPSFMPWYYVIVSSRIFKCIAPVYQCRNFLLFVIGQVVGYIEAESPLKATQEVIGIN